MTTLTLEPPCDLISANGRLHFRKRAELTKKWRGLAGETAALYANTGFAERHDRAHITVTIRFATNHRRDVGNYYPTAKAIVDGLVDAGVLPDDDDRHLIGPDLRREYPNGTPRVTVHIKEIHP